MTLEKDHALETRLSIRGVIAMYAVYWHKLAVDAAIFITTGCIALAGFSLTRTDASRKTILSLAIVIVLLGWTGAALCRLIARQTSAHQRILVKLDTADGLFDSGVLIENDSVYPSQSPSGVMLAPLLMLIRSSASVSFCN